MNTVGTELRPLLCVRMLFVYVEWVYSITCKNYAGRQLLNCWTPPAVPAPRRGCNTPTNPNAELLELSEVRRAMCVVCVPLDVEDTLCCFREALEKGNHSLRIFQHSRTLLLLLLAHTQPLFEVPFCKENSSQAQGHGRVDFNVTVCTAPSIGPPDLTTEDYSTLKYLQANNHDSLRVQALHDLGNLHYYNGNRRAANFYWSQAVDCALQSSGVLDSWDGVSWGTGSLQHQPTLRQAGSDLQYSSYTVGEELVPGLDLFSEPDRGHLGTTVSSLDFLCHWLYTSGHHLTALPMLALYLHFVGTVCRDPHLTIKGRILKVKVLTELGQYCQAMKETSQMTQGEEIPLPHGCYSGIEKHVTFRKFFTNKSLMDSANMQV
ncbi:unnamed protein product, partial [Coregonus sp. 'balchen']